MYYRYQLSPQFATVFIWPVEFPNVEASNQIKHIASCLLPFPLHLLWKTRQRTYWGIGWHRENQRCSGHRDLASGWSRQNRTSSCLDTTERIPFRWESFGKRCSRWLLDPCNQLCIHYCNSAERVPLHSTQFWSFRQSRVRSHICCGHSEQLEVKKENLFEIEPLFGWFQ